jgi:hypothetical protein
MRARHNLAREAVAEIRFAKWKIACVADARPNDGRA